MRKTILVVVILALAGGGWYAYTQYNKKDEPPTVSTAKVTRGDVAEVVGATGTLQAVTTVQVGSQVSGIVKELNADFNTLVHKGQVIARLDPSLFQTQIDQAKANLVRSEADLARLKVNATDSATKLSRAKELFAKKLISQADLEAAQLTANSADSQVVSQNAAVTQSQASLQQAVVNLEHTVIQAPIDGLVISRNVDVGQTVAASMSAPTLFVLAADLTKMQVVASLDESDVGRIRPGQNVTFRVDAYPTDVFTGSVTQVRLQPTTVQNVVTYSTVIDVPNPALKLKPGMTANVNVEIEVVHDVLRVPNAALRFRPSNEIFAALGQTPPPAPTRGGRGGRGGAGAAGAPTGTDSNARPAPGAGGGGTAEAAQVNRPAAQAQGAPAGADPAARRGRRSADPNASGDQAAANGRGFGGGRGGAGQGGQGGQSFGQGGGRGGNMQERMAAMTPEERTAFLERMRARGIDPNAPGGGRGGANGGGRGNGGGFNAAAGGGMQRAGRAAGTPAQPVGVASSGATTIDALFGALPKTETAGQVWIYKDNKLSRVGVRLGVSDGQQSALLEGDLKEDEEVVTNVVTAAQRAASMAAGSAAPIFGQQQRGGGFPGQGPGGPGGGGGRGAAGGGGGRGR